MDLRSITRSRRRGRAARAVLAAAFAAVLLVAGCTATTTPEPTPSAAADPILDDHGLAGLDARQLIERLDAMPVADRPTDLIASVRPDEVLLTDDQGRETNVPIPEGEFYVSIAPYVNQTHDCHFHSLTTCLGELQDVEVRVTITDDATGAVVVDQALRTFDNGFVGLWLPQGIEGTLVVEHDGLSATSDISTVNEDDPTCLTTLRLS